jgi:carbohydrate kinase (thermoresistant glucokinase family)
MTGPERTLRVVVMGVAGSGKSTVGAALALRFGARFADADDLHPQRNIELMAQARPLSDDDREPWLRAVGDTLARSDGAIVVACSALARRYRDIIRAYAPGTRFVHLAGSRAVLEQRLSARRGHFMPSALLDSQLDVLEPLAADEDGATVDAALDPDVAVGRALEFLSR